MQVRGCVALVTGSSSGLGEAVARALAARGARVIVHGRDVDRCRRIADEIDGRFVVADLASPHGPQDLARDTLAEYGRLDILVNNAGLGWTGPFTAMSGDDLNRLIATNLTAPLQLTRALLPHLLDRPTSHACFVGSIAGATGVAGECVYAATKAGLATFADSLRLEAEGSGLHVSVVTPGLIDTPFLRGREVLTRRLPRPLAPAEVAAAVVRLIEKDGHAATLPHWLYAARVTRAVAPRAFRALSARFGESTRLSPPS